MNMAKEISPSKQVAVKTIFETFKILKENGGSLKSFEIFEELRKRLAFTEWEKERYESTGYIRWESILHFFTIDCIKAGFLQKSKGTWILTKEGEDAMKLGPEELLNTATKAFREWKNSQNSNVIKTLIDPKANAEEIPFEKSQTALLEQYEGKATESLRNYILAKNPYEFQDLVAALLSAMNYHISEIAPRGKDGGIDIIAYSDPLGTIPPRIIVQVKHRPEAKISSDEIQKLSGAMKRQNDVGIFVTSGEFGHPAKIEAKSSTRHIELIDFSRFLDLWIKHYEKMTDEQKYMLPLHPIYFLGSTE